MLTKTVFKRIIATFFVIALISANLFSVSAMNFEFSEVSQSVFVIVSSDRFGYSFSTGSGFAISENYIVTNAHVIINEKNIMVGGYSETAENNIGEEYVAEFVCMDEELDIAVLYVDGASFTPLEIADVSTIKEGQDAYAIGTPENLPYTLTKGTISARQRIIDGTKYVQTDAAINQGNSGGPLLNDDGEVIGINTLKLSNSENIGFAIRIDEVIEYLEDENLYPFKDAVTENEPQNGGVETENSQNSNQTDSETDDNVPEEDREIAPEIDGGEETGSFVYIAVAFAGLVGVIGIAVILICVTGSGSAKERKTSFEVPVRNGNEINTPNSNFKNAVESENKSSVTNDYGCINILTGKMSGYRLKIRDGKTIVLGKDAQFANIVFDSSYRSVSRVHCSISFDARSNKFFVVDNSSNGTYFINGQRCVKGARIPASRGSIIYLANQDCKIQLI